MPPIEYGSLLSLRKSPEHALFKPPVPRENTSKSQRQDKDKTGTQQYPEQLCCIVHKSADAGDQHSAQGDCEKEPPQGRTLMLVWAPQNSVPQRNPMICRRASKSHDLAKPAKGLYRVPTQAVLTSLHPSSGPGVNRGTVATVVL